MKIIHCADLHLDSNMTANLTKEKARERKRELLNTFNRMIQYAVDHDVAAIIIAGDLYDKRNISVTARNTVHQAILNNPEIDFFYLRGNHDADSFLGSLDELPDNLKLFEDGWTTYYIGTGGEAQIAITGVELSGGNQGSIYNTLTLGVEHFNIVVMHGQEVAHNNVDKTECISLRSLRNKGIDYLALGHVHTYKKEMLDSRGYYCYSGCLEGRGFDECGEHGFVVIEIDEETQDYDHQFVPMADRRLYSVPVDITDCMTTAELAARIRARLGEWQYSERDLLKIILTGAVDVECEKDISLLIKQFESEYYFVKIADKSKLKVDYQSFALDASLKGEFVRTVMASAELDDDEKATIIRYGIQALAGEEIK